MKESASEFTTTKVLKCEKDDQGSLDLVVKGDGAVLDCINSMLGAEDFCFEKAEEKKLFEMDPYKEVDQKLLTFLADQINIDIERLNSRGEDVDELKDKIKGLIFLIIENINNEQNALKDGLTDLYNRKFLNGVVRNLFEENIRRNKPPNPISVIMFDADNFKNVNDTYGHQAGDQVLKSMARIMKNSVRKGDFCIRYGGEEFTFILFNCNKENAVKRGEQFRKMIESFKTEIVQDEERLVIPTTVSIGVATYEYSPDDQKNKDIFGNLIKEADECMYESKENNRNNLAYYQDGQLCFTKDNFIQKEKIASANYS